MSRDDRVAEPLAEVSRQPLRQPPRVHEHQRRPVRRDQRGQAIVVLLPHLVGHDRLERRPRNLQPQVHLPPVPFVYDCALGLRGPGQVSRDFLDGILGGGETDTL